MDRAEIDPSDFADVCHRWAGNVSLLVDRIRPVLALFGIPDEGLDVAATDAEHLTEWLSSNLQQWSAHEILSAARKSRDDHAMGMAAWRVLGDVARLPASNGALTKLGDRYSAAENRDVEEQTATHIEAVTPLLRGFSRHVAIEAGNPDLFRIGNDSFVNACDGCASLDDVRKRLGLDPGIIHERRRERLEGRREAERRQRTFDVAGFPFEVGASSYSDLLEHLNALTAPEGPRVNRDEFTPLDEASQGSRNLGGDRAKKGRISSNRPPPEVRDLVGVVGEMQAYRFLRAKFGKDVVTRSAWVSEIRLKILPPVTGESENTSDAHGFDFQFRYHRKRWHIEVKATMGDDPKFELGISEIEAANRLVRTRGGLWRILRIRNALSNRPEFDWLPNPFEGDFRKHFRFYGGGMMMSYARKKP